MKKSGLLLVFLSTSIICLGQSMEVGVRQFENEQYEQAERAFRSVDDESKDYAKAQYYLGRIAFDRQEYSDAEEYFEEAIDNDDSKANYHYWYGNAVGIIAQDANVLKQGFLAPKIKNAYESAVKLDPKMVDAHWGLLEYYTLAPGFMGGSWEKAMQTAEKIKKLNIERGYLAAITVYLRQEKFSEAEQEYKKLLAIDGKYILNLGYFYQSREEYDKAFDLFEQEYQKNPANFSALYQIGRTSALSGKRSDLGIKSLNTYLGHEVVEDEPSHAAALMRLGMIYEKTGDKGMARKNYQKSLDQDPTMKLAKEGLKRVK
ncbi:MAG: tetratricopeptide repeat protein [Bacteroidota bacterium]